MTTHGVNDEDSTSLSLLERVRRNEGDAWTRFVDLYDPLLRLWCLKAGMRDPHIDDVKQEVFIAVKKHLAKFTKDSPGHSFRAWLRTVTASKMANHWREHNADVVPVGGTDALHSIAAVPDSTNSSQAVELGEERAVLYRRAVDLIKTDFDHSTWMAFWRTTIDGVSAGNVADELDMSKNAVHLAKRRVLKRLREEFMGLIEGQ